MGTIKIPTADVLKKIYGETEESSARYTNLAVNFEKKYHHDKAEFFTAAVYWGLNSKLRLTSNLSS